VRLLLERWPWLRTGAPITFGANELRSSLDCTPIQIVQPLSRIMIAGCAYDLSQSDLAADHLERVRVLGTNIWMPHVFDSIAMKVVFQRVKVRSNDLTDALGMARACRPNDPYVAMRSAEIGFRRRERAALGHIGLGAPAQRSFPAAA